MEHHDLRVLLITRSIADPARGDRAIRFATRLESIGVEPVIVCVEGEEASSDGPEVLVCPGLDDRWKRPWIIRLLRLAAEDHPADIIHALELEMADAALAIAELLRVPYLVTVDAYPTAADRIRVSERYCGGFIATRRELAEELTADFGIPLEMLVVAPEGMEPRSPRPTPRDDAMVPVIGSAISSQSGGGLLCFLNAARILTDMEVDAEYLVAWDREEDSEWRRRVERLGLSDRVTLSAVSAWEEPFWSAIDVYCHTASAPSVNRNLISALARGVPTVMTDVDGQGRYVPAGYEDLLVKPNDPEALATVVARVLRDPTRMLAAAERGREIVARLHDPDEEARTIASLYAETLARSGSVMAAIRSGVRTV